MELNAIFAKNSILDLWQGSDTHLYKVSFPHTLLNEKYSHEESVRGTMATRKKNHV